MVIFIFFVFFADSGIQHVTAGPTIMEPVMISATASRSASSASKTGVIA